MKNILIFILLVLFLDSCACQKVYNKYPDCVDYFSFLEKSWVKKDNGYFMVTEIPDTTKPIWAKYVEPPQFQQRWNKNRRDCLFDLTEKEVKILFGEPSRVKKIRGEINDNEGILYRYYIADDLCNEENADEFKPVRCSIIEFTFRKVKQGEKQLLRPRLILNDPDT